MRGRRTSTGPCGRRRTGIRYDDRGSVLLEFTGFLPTLLVIGLAVIQLGLVGFAFEQASSGARAAARAESLQSGSGTAAGGSAMSDWLDSDVGLSGGEMIKATVTVDIPTLLPFVNTGWTATRSVTMPRD